MQLPVYSEQLPSEHGVLTSHNLYYLLMAAMWNFMFAIEYICQVGLREQETQSD